MNYRDKAKDIYKKVVNNFGGVNSDKEERKVIKICNYIVDEIIDSLKITTSHCTLNRLDENEVLLDFNYWFSVKSEINKL